MGVRRKARRLKREDAEKRQFRKRFEKRRSRIPGSEGWWRSDRNAEATQRKSPCEGVAGPTDSNPNEELLFCVERCCQPVGVNADRRPSQPLVSMSLFSLSPCGPRRRPC